MYKKEKTTLATRSLSGLVNYHGFVIGISDEFHGLFVRSGEHDAFHDFSSFPEEIDYKEQKKLKPDFESLSLCTIDDKDFLVAFPSLSKPNRNYVGIFEVSMENEQFQIQSYKKFRAERLLTLLSASSNELNIEGHIFIDDHMFLLNRGNQKTENEFIKIENAQDWLRCAIIQTSDCDFRYTISRDFVNLGNHDGHPIHWTEGVWDEGSILFLATIEKTDNAYDDGDVLASFIGRFDFKSNKIIDLKKILDFKKAEGICRWQSRYLISIDSDSAEMANEFYSLPLDVLGRSR